MKRLDGTTGWKCALYRGATSELPCGRKAVACLLEVKNYPPVCRRCLNEHLKESR